MLSTAFAYFVWQTNTRTAAVGLRDLDEWMDGYPMRLFKYTHIHTQRHTHTHWAWTEKRVNFHCAFIVAIYRMGKIVEEYTIGSKSNVLC